MAVAPTATGTLESRPLVELLVYALDRALNGTLVIDTPGVGKSAILFVEGAPAKAKTARAVHFLGQVMVDLGGIDAGLYRRGLETSTAAKRLFGEVLLEFGVVSARALEDALHEQIRRKVGWMLELPKESVYGYYDRTDFLQRFGGDPTRVPPLPLIWRSIREHAQPERMDQTLDKLGTRALKLHFRAPLGHYGLNVAERAVVDVLRVKPQAVGSLVNAGVGKPEHVCRVIYALAVTRQLDFGTGASEPLGLREAQSSQSSPTVKRVTPTPGPDQAGVEPSGESAPPSDPDGRALLADLRARVSASKDQTLYQVLGVAKADSAATVSKTFFALAKSYHPDRVASRLPRARELAVQLFAKLSEAHQVLSDERRRAEYNRLLAEGGASDEEQRRVAQVVNAATAFQKAEVLLKKNDLRAALTEAQAAAEGDPEQADYQALFAWIQLQLGEKPESVLPILNQALKNEPSNRRALLYRGQVFKRLGQADAAVADFRSVLHGDPDHLDALREVRLYEMRKQSNKQSKSKPPDPGGAKPRGLLDRLLKR